MRAKIQNSQKKRLFGYKSSYFSYKSSNFGQKSSYLATRPNFGYKAIFSQQKLLFWLQMFSFRLQKLILVKNYRIWATKAQILV